MAKSQRASRTKKNNTALKNNLFGPAEQARAQRLNDKLLAIAAKPTPAQLEERAKADDDTAMDVEQSGAADMAKDDSMDVDAGKGAPMSITQQKKIAKSTSSFRKKRRGKARNQIVFGKMNKERNMPKAGKGHSTRRR